MQLKFHKFDPFFSYPRFTKWLALTGETHHQFGFLFNVDIITRSLAVKLGDERRV